MRRFTFWLVLGSILASPLSALGQRIVRVQARPARATLGKTGEVRIRVQGGRSLRAVANVGTVTPVSGGRATYTPPTDRRPQVAVILVYGDGVAGAVAIPLWGWADLPVQTEPEATVVLEAGGRRFGPVRANSSGRATIRFELPPGVRTGTLIARDRVGHETRRPTDLGTPETPRSLGARVGGPLTVGEEGEVTVAFAAASTNGRLLSGTRVSVEGLEVISQRAGRGVLVAKVRAGTRAGRIRVTGHFSGGRATAAVRVRPGPPERIDITPSPESVPADGRTKATIRAAIVDRHGNPTGEVAPSVSIRGVDVVEESTEGSVVTAVIAPRALGDEGEVPPPARIHASGEGHSAELSLHWFDPDALLVDLTIQPSRVVAGDEEPVTVLVFVKDGWGRPPEETLRARIESEVLDLRSELPLPGGQASIRISPGTRAGRHVIHVRVGDAESEATLQVRAAAPSLLRASFGPVRTRPGGRTSLRVELLDRHGNIVPDAAPSVRSGRLQIGDFRKADEDDAAVATVTVPPDATEGPRVVLVEAAGFSTRARLDVVGVSALYAGASVGLSQNLGVLLSFPVAVDVGYRPALPLRPLSVGLEARYAGASGEGDLPGDARNDFELDTLVLHAAASYRFPLGWLEPFVEAAGGVAFVRSKVRPSVGAVDERSSVAPSVELGGGGEVELGPGRARAALRLGHLPLPEPLEGSATRLLLLVGYRLDL